MKKVRTYGTGMSAQTAPSVGLYVASAMPRMKPPPTHVAARNRKEEISFGVIFH